MKTFIILTCSAFMINLLVPSARVPHLAAPLKNHKTMNTNEKNKNNSMVFTHIAPNVGAGLRLPTPPELTQMLSESYQLSAQGDKAVSQGQWQVANQDYQEALALLPDNSQVIYGLATCAAETGDVGRELKYYRDAIYSHDPAVYGIVPGDGYQENDVNHLMHFALLLDRVGDTAEAVSVYNHAVNRVVAC